jgi:hypothetical protein
LSPHAITLLLAASPEAQQIELRNDDKRGGTNRLMMARFFRSVGMGRIVNDHGERSKQKAEASETCWINWAKPISAPAPKIKPLLSGCRHGLKTDCHKKARKGTKKFPYCGFLRLFVAIAKAVSH